MIKSEKDCSNCLTWVNPNNKCACNFRLDVEHVPFQTDEKGNTFCNEYKRDKRK